MISDLREDTKKQTYLAQHLERKASNRKGKVNKMDEKVTDLKRKSSKEIEIFERKQQMYLPRNQANQNHQTEMLEKKQTNQIKAQ